MAEKSIGIGVIGLGVMGRTHLSAYERANDAGFENRLVAVSDADPERLSGRAAPLGNIDSGEIDVLMFDPATVKAFQDVDELLALDEIDLVSVCTHTDSHVEIALKALAAGKHVLVEKPVALTSAEVERLAEAARKAETLCMPAMCMRFWPGWDFLQKHISEGSFGAVRNAVFRRLGSPPTWAPDFYRDAARSGGALIDLHIHDVDFIRWCFGPPDSVTAAGDLDHVSTIYHYAVGPSLVVAEGGWDQAPGFPFHMLYTVNFEQATLDFNLGREQRLLVTHDGKTASVTLEDGDGYDGEVRHLLQAIRDGSRELRADLDDAVALARLLETERAMVEGG